LYSKQRLPLLKTIGLSVAVLILGAGVIFQDHIRHQVFLATIAAGSTENAEVVFLDTSDVKQIKYDPNLCVCPYCCKQP